MSLLAPRRWPRALYVWLASVTIAALLLSAPLLGYLWSQGAHITPEQWAVHVRLVELGIDEHHEPLDDAAQPGPQTLAGLLAAGASIVHVPHLWSGEPLPLAALQRPDLIELAPALPMGDLIAARCVPLAGRQPAPPLPPPRLP